MISPDWISGFGWGMGVTLVVVLILALRYASRNGSKTDAC